MSFRKYHESEGLAAISRAIREKKTLGEAGVGAKESRADEASTAELEPGEAKKRRKETAASERDSEFETSEKKKKKMKKARADIEVVEDVSDVVSKKKKKKKKKGAELLVDGEDVDGAEDGVRSQAHRESGVEEEPDEVDDNGGTKTINADESETSVLKLFELLHKQSSKQEKSTKKFLKAFSAEAPDAVRDAMLNRTSSVGARAVSLLMQVLQCEAGATSASQHARSEGQRGGSVSMMTVEEALHTESDVPAPAAHGQVLWHALQHHQAEVSLNARNALKQAEKASLEAARTPSDHVDQQDELQGAQKHQMFSDFYRSTFVDEFAEDLEHIRSTSVGKPPSIGLLVQFMEAGMNIFSDAEKQVSVFPETRKSGRRHGDAQVRHGLYGNII